MDALIGLTGVLAVIVGGYLAIAKRGRRKKGLWIAACGVVMFIGAAAWTDGERREVQARHDAAEAEAKANGFSGESERQAAVSAGISSAQEYRAWLAAEERRRNAEAAAAEARRKDEQAASEAERRQREAAAALSAEQNRRAAVKAQEEAAAKCRQDLQCWADKHLISATTACVPQVERLAKYDYQWTDAWLEPKLSHMRWQDKNKGTVTYIGDKLKLQNGFGAWAQYVYECDYNPDTKSVLDIRARAGRL